MDARLPKLGGPDCPRTLTQAIALLDGDYTWSEERADRWSNVWFVLTSDPTVEPLIRWMDTPSLERFIAEWVRDSRDFDPRSLSLPGLVHFHASALRVDLARLGIDVEDIREERISWNTAWDYISGCLKDPASHITAAVRGYKYVPTPAEIAAWDIHEREMNAQRPKGAMYQRFPRPWAGKPPVYVKPDTTMTAERESRRSKLAAMF